MTGIDPWFIAIALMPVAAVCLLAAAFSLHAVLRRHKGDRP